MEGGRGGGCQHLRAHEADIVFHNCGFGKALALDLKVTSPLATTILSEVDVSVGSAVKVAGTKRCPMYRI